MAIKSITKFIKTESGAAIILGITAIIALIWDNSPLSPYYHQWLNTKLAIHFGSISIDKPFLLWINDGLMALFFLLVGLEVKRELFEGELDSLAKATLPAIAALGGMIIPALFYLLVNHSHPELWRGWAIPAATDIAFSLGILALLGRRIPSSLKIFLTALAIFDDIGAIIVIAVFYTKHISIPMLFAALILALVLLLLNRFRVVSTWPYLLVGAIMWFCVLKSGVHATLVGIIVAFAIPLRINPKNPEENTSHKPLAKTSPARSLEHSIHPWIAYGILPLFSLANAGVSFTGFTHQMIVSSLPLGIFCGLFLGKQVGIFGFSWIAIKMRWASLPYHCRLSHIYGVALLAGVGFTMSLFIGSLAFAEQQLALVRMGVIAGSLVAGVCGYCWLRLIKSKATQQKSNL
jgi:NhaA family Na+:H+ antiporter